MLRPHFLGTGLLISLLFLGAAAYAQTLKPEDVRTPEMTPALAIGKMAYDAYCGKCHGTNGVGSKEGPPFLHKVYHPGHHGDGAFYRASREGAKAHHWQFGDMKPVEKVTDAQLEKIVTYVRALQKANGLF
jgi:mono/diheme cytochrome c family protein